MREIKFRAWGYDFREMFYEVGIINGSLYIAFDDLGYDGVSNRGEFRVMQYTGLKDRYGKEIYEGDILDSSYNLPVTGQLIKKRYVVAQDKGYYIAQARKHPYGSTALSVIHADAKVVGNIYENPELMDDANN